MEKTEKRAIVFMDYEGTFDDVENGKGFLLFHSLRRLAMHFYGNMELVVITSAPHPQKQSIKSDLSFALSRFPTDLRKQFHFLIESNGQTVCGIETDEFVRFSNPTIMFATAPTTKKFGVEEFLKRYDPKHKGSTCIFAGNDEYLDLDMIDAEIGNRQKYMILANRRVLKAEILPKYARYKVSMAIKGEFNFGEDIRKSHPNNTDQLILKTSTGSYGVSKGLDAVTSLLKEKERCL